VCSLDSSADTLSSNVPDRLKNGDHLAYSRQSLGMDRPQGMPSCVLLGGTTLADCRGVLPNKKVTTFTELPTTTQLLDACQFSFDDCRTFEMMAPSPVCVTMALQPPCLNNSCIGLPNGTKRWQGFLLQMIYKIPKPY
jgi:hypothetical protein